MFQQTIDEGDARAIPDSDCIVKTLNTPYHHAVHLHNAEGSFNKTVEVYFKFSMVNYKVLGMADNVDEVTVVLKPSSKEFIILEKIEKEEPASVKISYRYCIIEVIETEKQVIAKMLSDAETKYPDALKFKG